LKKVDGIEYLTGLEAAKYLNVGRSTFERIRSNVHLKPWTILGGGNALYYKRSDLDAIPRVEQV